MRKLNDPPALEIEWAVKGKEDLYNILFEAFHIPLRWTGWIVEHNILPSEVQSPPETEGVIY